MLFLALSFITTTLSYSQSSIWSISNQYYDWPNGAIANLPTGTDPALDYSCQQAQYAANAWHNPVDGSLLFFVVDGIVYDRDGYYLGSLDEYDLLVNNNKMRGISEISIVPDSGNCLRYYIIGSRRDVTGSNPGIPANNRRSTGFPPR